MSTDDRLFSLVVPVLNEEAVLADTYATLRGVLESLNRPYEVVMVDNGSSDRTPVIAAELCHRDPRWRYLRLSRNFGYQNSITAGMLACQGDAIMVIDADLQDPPELIPHFVRQWEAGHDIVYGIRDKRTGEPWWRVWPTMAAMRLITWMSDDPKLPAHSGDFRLISRRVCNALALMPETNRYVRGVIHWLGFKQLGIPYTRLGRTKGNSKMDWLFLLGFAYNIIINFSAKPIRAFSMGGLAVLGLTVLLAFLWLCGILPNAFSSLHLLGLLNLGVLSAGLGVMGEYVHKVHMEAKRRPLWLVDYTVNLDPALLTRPLDAAAGGAPPFIVAARSPDATRAADSTAA
jgi:dolichol-phosphate mannosyltransferase